MTQEIRLNLGCGLRTIEGFDNIDSSPSVILARHPVLKNLMYKLGLISKEHYETQWPKDIIYRDASKRLPYASGSVDRIYSSHFIEHLRYATAMKVLLECRRILKPDGIFRLVVPDLMIHAKRYLDASSKLVETGEFSREAHDAFLYTVCGGFLFRRRSAHYYMYDWPTLKLVLEEQGFADIKRCEFGQSEDPVLAAADNRPDDSLIVECRVSGTP